MPEAAATLEDLDELLGEDLVTGGAPPELAPEPSDGDGKKPKDDASGTPDTAADDDSDGDNEARRIALAEARKRKAQDRAVRLARENTELRMRLREIEATQQALVGAELQRQTGSIDVRLEAAQQRAEKAIDDGDAKAQLKATRELAALERERERAEDLVRQARAQPPSPQVEAEEPAEAEVNDLAQAWMDDHPWFDPASDSKESRVVNAMSAYVAGTLGIGIDDPKHYEELNARLAKDLPRRFRSGPTSKDGGGERDLAPTAGSSRMTGVQGNPAEPAELRDVKVTQAEVKAYKVMMEEAGMTPLDWNKPADRTRMKQLKLETMQRNARRG